MIENFKEQSRDENRCGFFAKGLKGLKILPKLQIFAILFYIKNGVIMRLWRFALIPR